MDVLKIASLARLHIAKDQMEGLSRDMDAIVRMVEGLPEDSASLPESSAAMELREDVVMPSLSRAAALQNAPASDGEYIIAPKVME